LFNTYLAAYENLDSLQSEIVAAAYDDTALPPHTIQLRTQFVFTGDEADVPSQAEIMRVLDTANLMDYMLNYLHASQPAFNVFTGTFCAWS